MEVDLRLFLEPICGKIYEFNYAYGVIETLPPKLNQSPQTFLKALDLIESEYVELEHAMATTNRIEIIDALGDIIYLIIGLGARTGFRFDVVYQNSIIKANPNWDEITDVLKTRLEEWKLFGQVLRNSATRDENSWLQSFYSIQGYQTLLDQVVEVMGECGSNPYDVVSEIHKSNMAKFALTEEHAKESVEQYLTWVSPTGETYSDVTYVRARNGLWIIKDLAKNKVLKAKGWTPPDLSSFVK